MFVMRVVKVLRKLTVWHVGLGKKSGAATLVVQCARKAQSPEAVGLESLQGVQI
jgi:hypothetical protein